MACAIARFAALCGAIVFLAASLVPSAAAQEPEWGVGAYIGKYYDTEPAGALTGRAGFEDHYLLALTGSKTLWRADTLPLTLELDGMVGWQEGKASLSEMAVAPALRWSGLSLGDSLRIDLRAAPLGISHTSSVSPMEHGRNGQGSQTLNWLFLEATFYRPSDKSNELFVRLHHRCAIYDVLNDYGANGEDFLSLGFRRRF
jgi:hypothetical protein